MSGLPIVQPGVLDAIRAHVNAAWARKVGGILLGRSAGDSVRVEGALPARQTEEYVGEIAFPPSVWEEAYAALDQYPGAGIVGWYHSHPGTGVALSDYDRRLHTTLFGAPTNVALVLDPIADRLAWFGWTISELPSNGGTRGGSTVVAAPAARDRRGRRVAVAGLVALGVAAGSMGGYWLSDQRADQPPSASSLAGLVRRQQAEIQRLRRDMERARQALVQEQGVLRKLRGDLDATTRALKEARRKLREATQNVPTTFVIHYRVKPGDSLWDLARTFYGNPLAWPKILETNRDRVPDPDHLAVGQVLTIVLTK